MAAEIQKELTKLNEQISKLERKIDYLHKNGVLRNASYSILDKAREARNKIHADPIVGRIIH